MYKWQPTPSPTAFLVFFFLPAACLDLVSTDKSPLDTSPPASITFSLGFCHLIAAAAAADPLVEKLKHVKTLPLCCSTAALGKRRITKICAHSSIEFLELVLFKGVLWRTQRPLVVRLGVVKYP